MRSPATTAEAPAAAAAEELLAELTGGAGALDMGPADEQGQVDLDDPLSSEGVDFATEAVDLGLETEAEPEAEEAPPPPLPRGAPPPVRTAIDGPPVIRLAGEKEPEKPKSEITTNTIAELYIKQGFHQKALDIYRSMLAGEPDNADVKRRIRQLEAKVAGTADKPVPAPGPAPARPVPAAPKPAGAAPGPRPPAAGPKPAVTGPAPRPAGVQPGGTSPSRPAGPGPRAGGVAPRPAGVQPGGAPPPKVAPTQAPSKPQPADAGRPDPAGTRAARNIQTLEAWLQNIKRR